MKNSSRSEIGINPILDADIYFTVLYRSIFTTIQIFSHSTDLAFRESSSYSVLPLHHRCHYIARIQHHDISVALRDSKKYFVELRLMTKSIGHRHQTWLSSI